MGWLGYAAMVAGCSCRSARTHVPVAVAEIEAWVLVHEERFEDEDWLAADMWRPDELPDDGPVSDASEYFRVRGIQPPPAHRMTLSVSADGWLTVEAYSRAEAPVRAMIDVVPDPDGRGNQVLRLRSPEHTDAVVVRTSRPLPPRYRVSARIGYPRFGDGRPGSLNGYDGGERALPWLDRDATRQNGFTWLAILDTPPRPHNNLWIHHHRKVGIDSDNHYPPWMEIYDGTTFVKSGEHPVMMFAIDGAGPTHPINGKPFLSWSAGTLHRSGAIRAVDSYVPDTWYRVSIERTETRYVLEVAGQFRHGGETVYRAVFDLAKHCVWHYNQPGEPVRDRCVDQTPLPGLESDAPAWPRDSGWPDYAMLGDPHNNYYEGEVLIDDIRLEVPADDMDE